MQEIFDTLRLEADYQVTGEGSLPSRFAVTPLAAASVGAVACAMAELTVSLGLTADRPSFRVDRRLSSLWFGYSIKPEGWELPPIWDAIAGDYATKDGWIRLHTNLPHHRAAAMRVLGCTEERDAVATIVGDLEKDELEANIVAEGGVAAAMHSMDEWGQMAQGKAVALEPLVHWQSGESQKVRDWQPTSQKPLAGLRVLDLTRVLAGPVATRTLAGFGADVLRIDPPDWEEDNVVPDVTLGKRCARLDLAKAQDRATFEALLAEADVLIHGYRPAALEDLGLGGSYRRSIAPNLLEVTLDAYGWTGPWARRRGFDSLVQMSSGIADAGMHWKQAERPLPLPVQALDHATGYLMAASLITMLARRNEQGSYNQARLSLARTAELLKGAAVELDEQPAIHEAREDYSPELEATPWGPAWRLMPPLEIEGVKFGWKTAASALGSSTASWI